MSTAACGDDRARRFEFTEASIQQFCVAQRSCLLDRNVQLDECHGGVYFLQFADARTQAAFRSEADCVLRAGTDCNAVRACAGQRVVPGCGDPHCDGEVAVTCGETGDGRFVEAREDCSVTGESCERSPLGSSVACGIGTCVRDSADVCEGSVRSVCLDGVLARRPCAPGETCQVVGTEAECVGAGDPCETDTCEGAEIATCRGGRVGPRLDCELVPGLRCSGGDCVAESPSPECLDESGDACDGDTLTYCLAGLAKRFDCRANGWQGCSDGSGTEDGRVGCIGSAASVEAGPPPPARDGGSDAGPVELSPPAECSDAPAVHTAVSSVTAVLRLGPVASVDLLFMIDNSNSMVEEQQHLAEAFPVLLDMLSTGDSNGDGVADFVAATDIRVGFVTSDMGTGGLPVPTCSDPDGDDGILLTRGNTTIPGCAASYPSFLAFQPAVDDPVRLARDFACVGQPGTRGCGFEQQLEAVLKAVTPSTAPVTFVSGTGHADGANAGFLRPDAVLAIVLLTDEEDCSASDPEIFNSSSVRFPGDSLNLRCFMYGDPAFGLVHPIARYRDGLLAAVGGDPGRLVVAAITGVPTELLPTPDAVDFDAVLAAPEMQEMIDPMDPNRLLPSCNVPGLGIAFPPRRIVTLAREIDLVSPGSATVQSICQADLTGAMRSIARKIGEKLFIPCLPRRLAQHADGTVSCELTSIARVACRARPGSPPCVTALETPGCTADADGCCLGIDPFTGESRGQICVIPQVGVSGATGGWQYITDASVCGQSIVVTDDYRPDAGTEIRLSCLQSVTPDGCGADEDCRGGAVCHLGACVTRACAQARSVDSRAAGSFCHPTSVPEGGFGARETYLATGEVECGGGPCLVYELEGVPSCDPGDSACSPTPEEVASLWCTCRCAGSDPSGSYCTCPADMTCESILPIGSELERGSYCVRR